MRARNATIAGVVLSSVLSAGAFRGSAGDPLGVLPAPMPTLKGDAAIAFLTQQGSYDSLQAALTAARYQIVPASQETGRAMPTATDAHVAPNPQQQYQTTFTPEQIVVTPRTADGPLAYTAETDWQIGLKLSEYGYGEQMQPVSAGTVTAQGDRIEIRRGTGSSITEWYVNRPTGLEQGFTIHERPDGSASAAPLRLNLAMSGNLEAEVRPGAQSLAFLDASGRSVLMYDHLVVTDATGRKLSSHLEASGDAVSLVVMDAEAVYPVTVDPTLTQQAYLKASNTGTDDSFGSSVAISGDTVVVGAYGEGSNATGVDGDQSDNSLPFSGAAYVFVRNGTAWSQQAYLKAATPGQYDVFGYTVSISGDTIVVGAYGEASNATGVNGDSTNNSATNAGAAYVYVRSGSTWSLQAYLKASNTDGGDGFGESVAISGDTIVVGAAYEDSSATGINGDQASNGAVNSGAAYVFTRTGITWSQQAYLKASNSGNDDQFGHAVSISGDTVLVAALNEASNATGVGGNQNDDSAFGAGAAYVFVRSAGVWSQQAYLKASNTDAADGFGYSVAIAGDTAVVGARYEASTATGVNGNQGNNALPYSGAAYVFVRSGSTWSQQAYLKPSNTGGDDFGISVAVAGDTIVVGAFQEDSNATGIDGDQNNNLAPDAGAAYVFARTGSTWSQRAYLKGSNTGGGDNFGYSVAVQGSVIAVGAQYEDSNATGVNGNQSNNSTSNAGAAYLFTTNVVQNGDFGSGATNWLQFAMPDMSYIVWNVTNGVFQFYRNAPPPGTSSQAVAFQQTGMALPSGAPITAAFDLGNSDSVRKRVSVLVHDSDFTDLSVCTFWLPANAPLARYGISTHTTKAWTSATVSFYAASANGAGNTTGFYRLDNVSVEYVPGGATDSTSCLDATAPPAPGGPDGANMLVNGDFGSPINTGSGWSTFGQIAGAVNSGVFEFIKNAGTPAGVLLQPTSQAAAANELFTATFDLGNSSTVRKRVTVIIHDNNFSDLSACTFWLAPGQALSSYVYRTFATQAWTNATLSIYPATVGAEQWIRLDNVTLQRTPSVNIGGAQCLEPGSIGAAPAQTARPAGPPAIFVAQAALPLAPPTEATSTAGGTVSESTASAAAPRANDRTAAASLGAHDWIADGFTRGGEPSPAGTESSWVAVAGADAMQTLTRVEAVDLTTASAARLIFESWLASTSSRALVQVSADGATWETVRQVDAVDAWVVTDVDLTTYAGASIQVRFVFDGIVADADAAPDVWRVGGIRLE